MSTIVEIPVAEAVPGFGNGTVFVRLSTAIDVARIHDGTCRVLLSADEARRLAASLREAAATIDPFGGEW